MITFEVFVNGEKRFTAGGDYQTLVTSLTRVRIAPSEHVLIFNTSGIEPEPLSAAHWPECDVRVGDWIEIRVLEGDYADPPERIDDHEITEEKS
ncbi:MAG: hypothetical protein U1F98_10875 [Verrucomicrobiota bacterium]